jgi:hypothetical protein
MAGDVVAVAGPDDAALTTEADGLTDQQMMWAVLYAAGVAAPVAAAQCGYARPDQAAWRLKSKVAVMQAVAIERLRLADEYQHGSLSALRKVADDKGEAGATRAAAARSLFELATELRAQGVNEAIRTGLADKPEAVGIVELVEVFRRTRVSRVAPGGGCNVELSAPQTIDIVGNPV